MLKRFSDTGRFLILAHDYGCVLLGKARYVSGTATLERSVRTNPPRQERAEAILLHPTVLYVNVQPCFYSSLLRSRSNKIVYEYSATVLQNATEG